MKCEIIRDLLPSYIEGLTSEESNRAIEDHLKNCPDCSKYLEEMRGKVDAPEIEMVDAKEIRPFKKLKKRTWKAIGATVLICLLLFGGTSYYYGHEWMPSSEDVTVKCEKVGDVVTLSFYAKDEKITLAPSYLQQAISANRVDEQINLRARHISPFYEPMRHNAYFGYTFIDDETIYNNDGSERKLTDKDVVVIKYEDKDVKIKIKDLADGKL